MSTNLGEAYVKIGARLDALEAGLKQARKKTEEAAGGMSRAFKAVGAAWAAVTALKGTGNLLEGAFGSAMDRDRLTSGLTAALKVTGRYSDSVADDFARQAEELGKLPGITENQVREMQAMGIQAGISAKGTEALVRDAIELSPILGSASEAMKEIRNEMQGIPSQKLRDAFPSSNLKNMTDTGAALAEIDRLAARSGDVLRERMGSASGKVELLGKNFENLKADIGDVFVKTLADNSGGIMAVMEKVRAAIPSIAGHIKSLAENIAEFGKGAANALGPFIDALKFAAEHASKLQGVLTAAAKQNAQGAGIGGTAGAGIGFALGGTKGAAVGADVGAATGGLVGKLGDMAGEGWGSLIFGTGKRSGDSYSAEFSDKQNQMAFERNYRFGGAGMVSLSSARKGLLGGPGSDGAALIPSVGAIPKPKALNIGTAMRDFAAFNSGILGGGILRDRPGLEKAEIPKTSSGGIQGITEYLASLAQAGVDSIQQKALTEAEKQTQLLERTKELVDGLVQAMTTAGTWRG